MYFLLEFIQMNTVYSYWKNVVDFVAPMQDKSRYMTKIRILFKQKEWR
jgi:hypothetical protein